MSKIPLTLVGAELLRQELHRLKTVDRPAVINAISEARAQGDLSENAEYDIPMGVIDQRILIIRGEKVIMDADLAELYGVPTKRLNEQVKRNRERFPADFMFQ